MSARINRSSWVCKIENRFLRGIFILALGFVGLGLTPAPELSQAEFTRLWDGYLHFSEMEVAFDQTKHLTDLGISLSSQGKLRVIRPDTVIWKVEKPARLKVVLNAKEISIQSGADAPVERWALDNISDKQAANLKEMTSWLQFNPESLYRHFKIHPLGDGLYSFKPRTQARTGFTELVMKVGPRKNIRQIKMTEVSGDWIDIAFDEPHFKK